MSYNVNVNISCPFCTLWSTSIFHSCMLPLAAFGHTSHSTLMQAAKYLLPPLPSYMRHCHHADQSQADTGRLQLNNRSTAEAAHFWKPVTHDTLLENTLRHTHTIILQSLNFLGCNWAIFFFLPTPSMRIFMTSVKFFVT